MLKIRLLIHNSVQVLEINCNVVLNVEIIKLFVIFEDIYKEQNGLVESFKSSNQPVIENFFYLNAVR